MDTLKTFFTEKLPAIIKVLPQKTWEYIKIARVELVVLLAVLAFDQITKGIVQATMDYNAGGSWSSGATWIIPNFFGFWFTSNPAAGFGFNFWIESDASRRIVFLIFTVIAVIAFFVAMYRFRGKHWISRVTFALIIAGALGNFIDRAFYVNPAGRHGVRDFILFAFGDWAFPIFNIADMALVGGVAVFAIYFIFMYRPDPPLLVGPVWQEAIVDESNHIEI
ncbi:MAG: signal peptidase II [Firmicutes bacterium]|nr:signal peptidase II [Bacillota bacterium]